MLIIHQNGNQVVVEIKKLDNYFNKDFLSYEFVFDDKVVYVKKYLIKKVLLVKSKQLIWSKTKDVRMVNNQQDYAKMYVLSDIEKNGF